MSAPIPETLDVAIVGGGVAGLYCGWSLLARDNDLAASGSAPRVGVFEQSDRLGGRLFTARPPHAPHLACELGGMRYIDSQDMVVDLIAELGLETKVFPVGDENNLHFLRGARFSLAELLGGQVPIPYDLPPEEARQTPSQLIGRVLHAFVPGGALMTAEGKEAAERTMTFAGQPVTDASAIEVIRSLLSPAAYDFVLEGMGYTCILDDQIGAANLIHTDLRAGTWRTIVEGMQQLPLTIGKRFVDAGGTVALNHTVTRVERDGDVYRVQIDGPDGQTSVRAARVVLALPARALQVLDTADVLSRAPTYEADLTSVVPVPASKLYLGFAAPWWEAIGLNEGRSVTDQPIRQCLYFGVEGERGGEADNTSALLVASYSDGEATRYWERRVGEPPFFAAPEGFPESVKVSAAVVAQAREQLEKLHGTTIPEPEWAAFQDWTLDPYGGGWHYWRVGHKSVDVIPRLRRPDPNEGIFVCGEAFSSHQAWILGALSSTERVLRDHFGAAPPEWLRDGADIGA